ncbi:hypothetical protein Pmani_002801 [Petrolisthes manimaculis]|uniref:WAP domain-containing protein n=1 Tax=Petrolisthes manimaculis TaxID=1843537 RepID=A0AAE1QI01_9EUCA|nr:hypothetical protein Pmani_002801 [Petrolisthes manimaculis]
MNRTISPVLLLLSMVVLLLTTTTTTSPLAHQDSRCPFLDLAAATFPVGQSPQPCTTISDCPREQLCCPVRSSSTDLCLQPISRCPSFPTAESLSPPIPCNCDCDCPQEQICCPSDNSTTKHCLFPRPPNPFPQ